MTNELFEKLVASLDGILDEERKVLLAGDLEKITDIVDRKEDVIDQLSDLEASDSAAISALTDKLRRNQALLDQSLEGIRAVAKRLSAMRHVRRSLDTYDAQGEKHAIDFDKPVTLEKRA